MTDYFYDAHNVECFNNFVLFFYFQHIPNQIVTINAVGNRIMVGDNQESFFYVRYKRQDNQLIIFADDTNPRWITTACLLDCNTAAGADKFGNISIVCFQQLIY